MAKVTKNIVSPICVLESGESYISIDNKAFLVSENEITEAAMTSAPGDFRSLVLALDNFKVTNEGLTWYHGISRFRYVAEEDKFFINNSEVLAESFENHLIATGLVNYSLKSKVRLFEFAAKNHSKFVNLEFVEKIEEGDVICYVMNLNESFFVYRVNEANRIYKFFEANAADCFDYIKEQTGHELVMASELLEGERAKAAEKFNKISVLEEMIAFLKDQRGVIAEADKSIEEIKEADNLINSEIKRIEEEIEALKNETEEVEETEDAEEVEETNETEETEEVEETNETEETEDVEETEEVEEANTDAADTETMEDGEEAGEEAEEMESDAKEVDNEDDREAEGEEATAEAPEASGEDAADEVTDDRDEDDEVEDEGDSDIDDDDDDDDDEEVEETKEVEKKTNEAELEEDLVDREDGYVPGTLKFSVGDYAEGTELKIDAEGYTKAGQDESVNVFVGDTPLKVSKREIVLADSETI